MRRVEGPDEEYVSGMTNAVPETEDLNLYDKDEVSGSDMSDGIDIWRQNTLDGMDALEEEYVEE